MPKIDIIVPVKNEATTLPALVARIHAALSEEKLLFQIIVIDDHSDDATLETVKNLSDKYPIKIYRKKGKAGKAWSILEGAEYAESEILVMLDADLQYPPEAIPQMVRLLDTHGVVVANRKVYRSTLLRKFVSRTNKLIFGKWMFGLDTDIQSGLKVFRKEIIAHINRGVIKPWAFDIPLLFTALELGLTIGEVDITFEAREKGASKINITGTAWQIASSAVRLRLTKRPHYVLSSTNKNSMKGAGVVHRRTRFITHSTLPIRYSALKTLLPWQSTAVMFVMGLLVGSFILNPVLTLIVFIAMLSGVYFLDVLFSLFVTLKSLHFPPEIGVTPEELAKLKGKILPLYTVLCPLYKEAHVLGEFVENISKIDWPKHRLEVILLLEEDDVETIESARNMGLPDYFRILVVPDSQPKTKPKALNYGIAHAKGSYVVVYDAEDRPDPLQLKTAYAVFLKQPREVMCLQAKLNYYNPHHNLLTRLFTAEYSLWFDMILPGLQVIETAIPLGGTSNHFRTEDLRKLRGWDAFNVTEDADLGARLFKLGGKTAIIDSVTLEEANSSLPNWVRQRSRWLKGYLQTYFVHMRRPLTFIKEFGIHAFIFQLTMGGKIAFMVINPILWLMTIAYFAFFAYVGPFIESLYPTYIFYMAAFSLVVGNFLYLYNYMIGTAKRGHWPVMKYVFLVPFYWLAISYATVIAVIQLVVKPHYWEKTNHGLHLKVVKKEEKAALINLDVPLEKGGFSLLTSGVILAIASVAGNFFNFLYNAYLGRVLPIETYGTVALIGSFIYIAQIPLGAFGKTIVWKVAMLSAKSKAQAGEFWKKYRMRSFAFSLVLTILWLFAVPTLTSYFQLDSILPFLLFTPVWFFGTVFAVDGGYLNGTLRFSILAVIIVAEAITKFALSILFIQLGRPELVYAAIPLSLGVTLALSTLVTYRAVRDPNTAKSVLHFPIRFFSVDLVIRLAGALFVSFDLLLVKHYLDPVLAGQYSLLTLPGKMIFFFTGVVGQFVVPIVSRAEGKGKNSHNVFYKLLALQCLISCSAFLVVGIFGWLTIPVMFGDRALAIVDYLPIYGLAMVYFTTANALITFHQLRREYLVTFVSIAGAMIQVIGITRFHSSIEEVVMVMFVSSSVSLMIAGILHALYSPISSFVRNLGEILRLFDKLPEGKQLNQNKLRILIFNWRDTRHAWAGGAEVYLHELATRFVRDGHTVILFCGNDGKHKRNETVDGVSVIRRGGFYTVYLWAFVYYTLRLRKLVDLIIDSENGMPFFSPLYSTKPKFLLVHHVHQEVFQNHLAWPFSSLAKFIESSLMPLVYKNQKIVTVSNSSKDDIVNLGLSGRDHIEVINPGINHVELISDKKSPFPQFLYLGRLKAYKNVNILIEAFAKLYRDMPTARLVIAGEGEELHNLGKLIDKHHLTTAVELLGKVTEEDKHNLLASSWALVQPSSIEGWGITVIEANAAGTPVIASDVAGLRDSVLHGKTGMLVKAKDVEALYDAMRELTENTAKRTKLSKEAREWAREFDWDKSADKFSKMIIRELIHRNQLPWIGKIVLSK